MLFLIKFLLFSALAFVVLIAVLSTVNSGGMWLLLFIAAAGLCLQMLAGNTDSKATHQRRD